MLVSEAIERAYREGSIRPIGSGTPDATELDEGLYRLNALWKGIRATALGEVIHDWQLPNKTRTAPHDANNINQFYPQNLSGFNQPSSGWNEGDDSTGIPDNGHRQHYPPINCRILCKLIGDDHNCYFPQFPYDGARMAFIDIGMTETVTISANGRYINSVGTTSITFAPGDPAAEWLYRADKALWVRIDSDLALDDDLPLPGEFDDFFVCGTAIRLCALDQLDAQPATVESFTITQRKIMQRYYQPGIMSYGGQNAVPAMQNYNNYWGYGTNFRSGA